jgi:hypothetical protein
MHFNALAGKIDPRVADLSLDFMTDSPPDIQQYIDPIHIIKDIHSSMKDALIIISSVALQQPLELIKSREPIQPKNNSRVVLSATLKIDDAQMYYYIVPRV